MTNPTRRSVLRGSLALATAGSLVRPFIAKAAAKTATVWWVQGFAEDPARVKTHSDTAST
jgi:multiple sugar transport system substrate-binding protein